MIRNKSRPLFILLAVLATGIFEMSPPMVGTAHAIVGRPLTPMSYAGVARRTTRRAAYVGAATAPVAYPYPYPPPYNPHPYW